MSTSDIGIEAEDDSSIEIEDETIPMRRHSKDTIARTFIDGMEWKNIQYLEHMVMLLRQGFQRVNAKEFEPYGNIVLALHPCYFVNGDVIYVKNSVFISSTASS